MNTVLLQQPKRLYFGSGCAARAAEEFAQAGKKRIFVVTSPRAGAAAAGLFEAWLASGASIEVCDAVHREPEIALFDEVLKSAVAFNPDAVVGVGGGSPLDVAKLVAALVDRRQAIGDVFGVGLLKSRTCYLACIPTTAGTGSEVSPNAVLIDEAARMKRAAISPHLVPDVAFCDPELTVLVPASVTASTGLDALVHCIEAYANKNSHPIVDVYALEGIRKIGAFIERAVLDGNDRLAREQVMLGAVYGGLCLGPVNTAAIHALSYPLGGEYRIAHGVANSLLLPYVLRFNVEAMPERYADIARALGVPAGSGSRATAEAGVTRLEEISVRCRIPRRLRDLGVPADHLPHLAEEAIKVTRLLKNNPRELHLADAEAIYQQAF